MATWKMALFSLCHFLFSALLMWILNRFVPTELTCFCQSFASILLALIVIYYLLPVTKSLIYDKHVSARNKSVFITGCDSGFGHHLAKILDANGFQVFASCLFPNGPGAEALKNAGSKRLHILELDVTKDDSVHAAVDYVTKNLHPSKLWAVVNNAGIHKGIEASLTPLTDYKDCFEINTLGVVRVTNAFIPLLRKSKGRIVTVTSITGRFSVPHIAAYSMSKWAAVCFCECLRQELRPWGIKVISVEPELFKTPLTETDKFQKCYQESIKDLTEATKHEYGTKYFEDYQKYVAKILVESASAKMHKVVENLVDAVSLEDPSYVYRPCRHLFARWCVWMMELLPKPVLDYIIICYKFLTKCPTPKTEKEVWFREKHN